MECGGRSRSAAKADDTALERVHARGTRGRGRRLRSPKPAPRLLTKAMNIQHPTSIPDDTQRRYPFGDEGKEQTEARTETEAWQRLGPPAFCRQRRGAGVPPATWHGHWNHGLDPVPRPIARPLPVRLILSGAFRPPVPLPRRATCWRPARFVVHPVAPAGCGHTDK
jgi:hypothetical protein